MEKLSSFIERVGRKNFWVGLSSSILLVSLILIFPALVGLLIMMSGIIIMASTGRIGYITDKDERRSSRTFMIGIIVAVFGFLVVVVSGNADFLFSTGTP